MRTWGRVFPEIGDPYWVEVTTDPAGNNDAVFLTTLAQNLLLGLGESPFFGDHGIPAQQSVVTNVFPDFYVTLTQQRFSQYFASLIVTRRPVGFDSPDPIYDINVVTNQGVVLNPQVPVPI